MKREAKVLESAVVYIDPAQCASRIGFRIRTGYKDRVIGELELTSCDRMISWNMDDGTYSQQLAKLDAAIAMLIRARAAWVTHAKRPGKRKK